MRWPFPSVTVPEFLKRGLWTTVIVMEVAMAAFLLILEYFHL